MATTVASRYAVLSVDVDDDYSNRKKKKPVKKPNESKPTNTTTKSETNLKKKKKHEGGQNQNNKSRTKSQNSGGNSKKKKEPTAEQWEEWKQKDAQYVEGNYEEELTQAIMLSKLDYEEKKDFYKKSEDEKKLNNSKRNKKTHKVMSLDEFNYLGTANSREESPSLAVDTEKIKEDPEFFKKIKEDVKKEISKEQLADHRKVRESFSEEALTLAQCRDSLDKRDKEIAELQKEVVKLKEELHDVKTRNKKLCQILANGEMKDKAEVLMEVERLESVKDEFLSEISSLHAQLEQERSKVRALTGEHKTKDKSKKRTISSSDATQ